MSVKYTSKGWRVEIDRKGLKRVRKLFPTEQEAKRFERKYLESTKRSLLPPPKTQRPSKLIELIDDAAHIEQALIESGAIPGRDYRKLDLFKLALTSR